MTVHLIKLCVGADDIADLATWQKARLAEKKKLKQPQILVHVTRMTPKRADELLAGGSLYWVMKGVVRCRQKLVGIEPFTDGDGIGRCRLVLDNEIVPTRRQDRRPFQGWRYLAAKDAPPDMRKGEAEENMPDEMRRTLEELGLL